MKKLANRIRTIRLLRNLSQENVAEDLKMSQQGYSKIECGDRDIKFSKLEAIAGILGVRVEDILSSDDKIIFKIDYETNLNTDFVVSQNKAEEEGKEEIKKEMKHLKDKLAHLENKLQKLSFT
jgi:transcriptional regulator with XRE-family HTH domain